MKLKNLNYAQDDRLIKFEIVHVEEAKEDTYQDEL